MVTTLDFGPATRTLAYLVVAVRDDQLDDPTPCPDWTVADLERQIGGLTLEFTASAEKVPTPARAAEGLTDGWRERIQDDLADPDAVAACRQFVEEFDAPANDDGGLFGPPVSTSADAAPINRLVGLTGRDPAWPPA